MGAYAARGAGAVKRRTIRIPLLGLASSTGLLHDPILIVGQ
jgi:hypothetical protein